ncbi:uncharacterized protein BO95DRAFT_442211 [Aspergillus brunneoviolaceus CBS 621.78]|uniref:Uncharacterized protein n=1 Tax=Aspergillus brunneoviolaceus CBS 621.78 TaxID=1450534 RepID=A0ACD1GAP4_9EURO|nr:hypothetical protein BO95DRAFT_442211 [Aspergillus brunneoviolaceus CBS 621.78]RAH46332.1 hypothetical protein BO95DRAFT_442211 [Aspergillus brunneoviolaceus CBS 621.78]
MRTAFLSALSLLTLSAAAFNVSVTFHGATEDESYSLLFPTDTTAVQIDNPMIVYSISSPGGGFCTFVGVEGEDVVIFAEDEEALTTPQAMKWGSCDNN